MNVLLSSPLGALLAQPWVDPVGLFGAERWYLPLSRLWAAANAAGEDVALFRDSIGSPLADFRSAGRLRSMLGRHARARLQADAARRDWENAVFGAQDRACDAALLDRHRRRLATRHLLTRAWFYPLLFGRRIPSARWRIDGPDRFEQALGEVMVDPARIRQVFANLLDNALKYTVQGGQVKIQAQRDTTEVTVKFRDTGMGIEPDMLPRLFDVFAQADRSLDRSRGGLGLGLALVKGLVEMHGGTVQAASSGAGRGAEFTIRLPCVGEFPALGERRASYQARGRGRNILVIEDNDALRAMLFTVLRHQPLGVDTASNAEEAMERVRMCDYALILLDMNLPDDDSEEFLRRFRDFRPESTSFVLAVRDPRVDLTIEADMVNAVVNKPLEIDTLADVVRGCALVVTPPEDPLPCQPSESEVRSRVDRGDSTLPN